MFWSFIYSDTNLNVRKHCNIGALLDNNDGENMDDICDVNGADLDNLVDEGKGVF